MLISDNLVNPKQQIDAMVIVKRA